MVKVNVTVVFVVNGKLVVPVTLELFEELVEFVVFVVFVVSVEFVKLVELVELSESVKFCPVAVKT